MMYHQVTKALRQAYDRMVEERDKKEIAPWKQAEQAQFLALLQTEGAQKLLEIGAGTGPHGKFFQDNGLDVVCTDLSPAMVKACRRKGLTAYEMDFLNLDFPAGAFDAVFAMNCLLHVPRSDLGTALRAVRDVLKPGGLFFWGQYGGVEQAGTWEEDHYKPKRFFSWLTDEQIQNAAREFFELFAFKRIPLEGEFDFHFQALILRRDQ